MLIPLGLKTLNKIEGKISNYNNHLIISKSIVKILFVVKNYYPSVGGTQIFFQQMAEYFVQYFKDEIHVFTIDSLYGSEKLNYKKAGPKYENINGVHIHRFPYWRWHIKSFIFISRVLNKLGLSVPEFITDHIVGPYSPKLKKAMIRTDADIIVASSSNYLHMRYPLWRMKIEQRKPFLFQGAIHFNINESRKVFTSKTLRAIQFSDVYLANTFYEKQMLIAKKVLSEKIQVVGCAVDCDAFKSNGQNNFKAKNNIPADACLVGYIGRISPMKSLDILLEAMKNVWEKNKHIYLVIAGHDNDYASILQKQINLMPMQISQQIILLTNLDEEQKINCFHGIDIFVMPSANESFGIVFLEAWACKKPVIGAGIKAIASVIIEHEDGLLMEPGNPESLAEKILLLANNSQMRAQLGNSGYKKVLDQYDLHAVAKKFHNICISQINQKTCL